MPRRTITQEEYDAMSPEEQARFMPLEDRVQQMYDDGVNARLPTPEQEARMDRMMRDLENIPDSTYDDLEAAATPLTPDPELRRPYYGRRVSMPPGGDGSPRVRGEAFASPEEAAAYTVSGRDPVTGARTPSGYAQDMMRGYNLAQIATDTGPQLKYSGEPPPMHVDGVINPAYLRFQEMVQGIPGDEDRGLRGKAPMWQRGGTMATPEGNETSVLVPSRDNLEQAQSYQDRLRADRQYQRDLISAMRANPDGTPAEMREAAMAARGEGALPPSLRAQGLARAEMDRRRQNMMIGGSQYRNAGNVGQIRELLALRDRNPEAYDELLADNMGPRDFTYRVNPRTGQIEASSTRAYPPADRGADTQVNVNPMQEQAMDERRRQTNPTAAGGDDMRRGEYASAEASMLLDTLAERFDTTTGGFSYENENQLAQHIVSEYGVPPEEATRLARRAANKRRRFWTTWFQPPPGQNPGSAPAGDAPPSTPGRSRTRRSGPTPRG
jgi:hypothetical protein